MILNFSISPFTFTGGYNHFAYYQICAKWSHSKNRLRMALKGLSIEMGRERVRESKRERDTTTKSVFTWRPKGAVKAHKSSYFTYMWEPTKHFSLLSVILIAQHDALHPQPPSPLPLTRWLFFNSLCLAPPLSVFGRRGPAGDRGCVDKWFWGSRANKTD